jgi:DNA replication and repair protein RecF
MYLRHLGLANFRCYARLELTLPCGTVVVAGRNGQGKSSLLEAVYVLATTRSPHAGSERELIHWAAQDDAMPFSRVWGEVQRVGGMDSVEVVGVLQAPDGGEPRFIKRARVNDAPRRALDVIGVLNVVLFTPRDLQIVDGAPAERRRYLDVLRCQVDHAYCVALARYNKVLTQRNHLLRRLRDRGGDRGELAYWDDQIVRDGSLVVERRLAAVAALDEVARTIHAELSGSDAPLSLTYRSSFERTDDLSDPAVLDRLAEGGARYGDARDPGSLADTYAGALAARREEEIARGATVVGPHRDDFAVTVGGTDMRIYGSRGQQRTVTLALKLAEARLMWRETGERPVLLLDDVLSELDADRRAYLLEHIDAHQQTFITTTEAERLPAGFTAGAQVLTVEDAAIRGAVAGRTTRLDEA